MVSSQRDNVCGSSWQRAANNQPLKRAKLNEVDLEIAGCCRRLAEYRTFRTKDFSHKSFSTDFGTFAQCLVVITHNNYK